jgi:hypothetical protein
MAILRRHEGAEEWWPFDNSSVLLKEHHAARWLRNQVKNALHVRPGPSFPYWLGGETQNLDFGAGAHC